MRGIYKIFIRLIAFAVGMTLVLYNAERISSLFGGIHTGGSTFKSAALPGKDADSKAVGDYCNNPHEIRRDQEGRVPDGYQLISLHMMIRHGNRLPMAETPGIGPFDKADISCKYDLMKSTNPLLLKQYIDNVDLNVKKRLHTPDPEPEFCAPSFLTQIGVEQHLANGQILQQAYSSLLNLKQSDMVIYCTNKQRTITSVFSLLSALLSNFQPEKINLNMVYNVEFCHKHDAGVTSCQCNRAVKLFNTAEADLIGRLQSLDSDHEQAVESVKDTVGLNDINLIYPWKLGHDFMMLPMCRGESLPRHPDGRHLTGKQADLVWASLTRYFQAMFKNREFKLSAELAMYPLHKSIRLRLEQQIDQSERGADINEKFTIFSGHDNSIQPLLLSMNVQISNWPPYASRFILEVYKPVETGLTYMIKFIYNGRDVTSLTEFCHESPCDIENYINWIDELVHRLGYGSYEEACSGE